MECIAYKIVININCSNYSVTIRIVPCADIVTAYVDLTASSQLTIKRLCPGRSLVPRHRYIEFHVRLTRACCALSTDTAQRTGQ